MRFMIIEDGVAVNAIQADSANALPGFLLVQSDTATIGDLWDGDAFSKPQPLPPTIEQYVAAMDANFDAKAAEKNYDSRITCALRAGYAGPFQAEGIAFAQWMDNSYAAAYLILAAVQAGERPAPTTTSALLAELPQFDWANV